MANQIQLAVRFQGFNELDCYRLYNAGDPRYPDNLPPPPNPDKLLQFFFACIEETIHQKNRENDPKAGQQSDPNTVHNRRPMSP